MQNLYSRFSGYITSLALALFLFGAPVIYFFRDGLGLAPNNMIFTVVFMILPMFLVFPFRNFRQLYVPNRLTYTLSFMYLAMSLFYLFYHHLWGLAFSVKIYELAVILIMVYVYLLVAMTSINELERSFLNICVILSVVGALGLIWHISQNPSYVLGRRASIITQVNGEENTGNPHIYSKGAYLGLVAALVMMKYKISNFKQLILIACSVLFLVVLMLTQAMSSILTTAIFLFLFFIFNTKTIASGSKNFIKKPVAWLLMVLVLAQGIVFFKKYEKIVTLGFSYIEHRVSKITESFLPSEKRDFKSKGPIADDSANMRLSLLTVVYEQMEENFDEGNYLALVFGNGYKDLYIDVPVVESFNSLGLVGFIIIVLLLYHMTKSCVLEMRRPSTATTEFIAYGFIYFLILCFLNGLIIDYIRWGFFAMVCRYLPLNSQLIWNRRYKKTKRIKQINPAV